MSDAEVKERSPEDIFRFVSASKGEDPNAGQYMSRFMDVDSHDETSYFPNQLTSIAIAQLRIRGSSLYRGHDWDPFNLVADAIGIGFKGYKGFKSEQIKDITSGQPNLDKLQGIPEETKKGILSRLFNRGSKTE